MNSVYIHIPFCRRRCLYCDFNTYAGLDDLQELYVQALCGEIQQGPQAGSSISTIFMGGGTPTILSARQLGRVLQATGDRYTITGDCEITVECNPSTAEARQFRDLVACGVNRLSMGVQSWRDDELALLGRTHTATEALEAFRMAQSASFRSVSLDLMYGLPGQACADWERSLRRTADLAPDHISAYCLILEPGTPLAASHERHEIAEVDEEAAAQMLELTWDFLPEHGWPQYEISNFAPAGAECRHNITYWRNEPYAGFGAGAVSYIDGERATRVRRPREYVRRIGSAESPITDSERLGAGDSAGEALMLGLRMNAGVSLSEIMDRYGEPAITGRQPTLDRLAHDGLLTIADGRLFLTRRGMLVASDVMADLL